MFTTLFLIYLISVYLLVVALAATVVMFVYETFKLVRQLFFKPNPPAQPDPDKGFGIADIRLAVGRA